ncbi:MAG: hypothetical protein RLZZ362_870 [Actinomycetota bacterium]|jgi:hypothetical protein
MTADVVGIFLAVLVVASAVALGIRKAVGNERLARARPMIVALGLLPMMLLVLLR